MESPCLKCEHKGENKKSFPACVECEAIDLFQKRLPVQNSAKPLDPEQDLSLYADSPVLSTKKFRFEGV